MTAKVIKILASWTSAACSCCPPDMCMVVIETKQGETLEIETTLVSEGETLKVDEDGDWLPQV